MKVTHLITVFILFFSVAAFAHSQGKGKGVQRHFQQNNDSTVQTNKPPGLQGSHFPPGLEKLNKTPPGWSKGKKVGWQKSHK